MVAVMTDAYGTIANVISDKVLRTGAKVWLGYPHNGCVVVTGLSHGGRLMTKWIHLKRLENFRAKWIPEHMRWGTGPRQRAPMEFDTREEAEKFAKDVADFWRGVRSFKRDGTLIRDGITEAEAYRRAQAKRVTP